MNRVRYIRKSKGMKLRQVAETAGCSIAFLSDVELNRRGAKPETWNKIADALGVEVDDLKGDDHGQADDDPAGG